jgi:hypothetical protein
MTPLLSAPADTHALSGVWRHIRLACLAPSSPSWRREAIVQVGVHLIRQHRQQSVHLVWLLNTATRPQAFRCAPQRSFQRIFSERLSAAIRHFPLHA